MNTFHSKGIYIIAIIKQLPYNLITRTLISIIYIPTIQQYLAFVNMVFIFEVNSKMQMLRSKSLCKTHSTCCNTRCGVDFSFLTFFTWKMKCQYSVCHIHESRHKVKVQECIKIPWDRNSFLCRKNSKLSKNEEKVTVGT